MPARQHKRAWFYAGLIAVFCSVAAQAAGVRDARNLSATPRHVMPRVDMSPLMAEDAAAGPGQALRVALAQHSDLTLRRNGSWSARADGGRLWQLEVESPGALSIALGFDRFDLPTGAVLHILDRDGALSLGPYTASDASRNGELWLPPVAGDRATLHMTWPAGAPVYPGALRLSTVSHGYRGAAATRSDAAKSGEGSASACNIDINCPLGNAWQKDKRGVVQLFIDGTWLCSGTLINTTAGDCRPYVLTAAHCVADAEAAAATVVRFDYENPGCEVGPAQVSAASSGARLLATWADSDFALLELDHAPPAEASAYYNGWNRRQEAPSAAWTIHHPQGDAKKISRELDPLVDGQSSGWGADHWRVVDWEDGTTEAGSSGSPLFDSQHRVVGQLHGGLASCANRTWDEYGKFWVSWNGGGETTSRLRDWLDPLNTGALTVDGRDAAICTRRSVGTEPRVPIRAQRRSASPPQR